MESKNTFLFQRHEMAAGLFSTLMCMKENDVLCDVTICVGSQSFQAHRVILAAGIPYFRAMFSSNMVECMQKEITLQDVDPLAMEHLINFVYTHELKLTLENVESLLRASSYLQLDLVVDACFEFMYERIDSSTVLVVHSCALLTNREDMIENAERYIRENFDDFSLSSEFSSLPFTVLKDIICKDSLFVMKEEEVFEAVMKWVKTSEVDRLPHLPELLSHVRMPFITEEYFNTHVCNEELIQALPACRDIISEAKKYYTSQKGKMKSSSFETQERFCKEKSHLKCAKLRGCGLYVISKGPSNVFVSYYDSISKKLLSLGHPLDIDPRFLRYVVCTEDNIYFLNDNCMQALNLRTSRLFTLLENDYFIPDECGAVFHQHMLYFLGGSTWNEVYSFDLQNGTLLKKGSTLDQPEQRSYPSVASMEEFIYITGGFCGMSKLHFAEKYNSITEKSSEIAGMLVKRFGHGCAALNGKIYVCGGNSRRATVSGEVYDPLCNQWSLLSRMTTISCSLCLLSYANELSVVDNRVWSEDGLLVKTYNPSDDEWQFGIPCSFPARNVEFLSAVVTGSASAILQMDKSRTVVLVEDIFTSDSSEDVTDRDDTV